MSHGLAINQRRWHRDRLALVVAWEPVGVAPRQHIRVLLNFPGFREQHWIDLEETLTDEEMARKLLLT
jgi:hypothetical protein